MFFLRDNLRIQPVTFIIISASTDTEYQAALKRLFEFQTLAIYLYSGPDRFNDDLFLHQEHGSLYVFTPQAVSDFLLWHENGVESVGDRPYVAPDARHELPGYVGILNGQSYIWVADGSRIYPSAPRIWLNHSQDLEIDVIHRVRDSRHSLLFNQIAARDNNGDLDERFLTALRWYNRAAAMDVDPDVAIASLAIAFETLLDLEQSDRVTERFKQAVTVLVGPVSRLDVWLDQFYDARSQVMHKGRSQNLLFRAVDSRRRGAQADSDPQYRSLVSFGRHLFQICVATVLTGMALARQLGLSSILVTNQQRFEKVCRELEITGRTVAERFDAIARPIAEIDQFRFVPESTLEFRTMFGAAKRVVQCYLEQTPDEAAEILTLLNEFANVRLDGDYYEPLAKLKQLDERLKLRDQWSANAISGSRSLTVSLLASVWHYTFRRYFDLERQRDVGQ